MSRLFDVADVQRGDGRWSGVPYDVPYDDQAPLIVQDVCTRANVARVAGSLSSTAVVYTIRPVGAMISASRPNRCVLGEFPDFEKGMIDDLDEEAERAAAYVLYQGIPGWTSAQPYLTSSDVATVTSGTLTVQQLVAAVLDAFYTAETGVRPVLHLGESAGVVLSAGNAMSPTAASPEFYLAMDGTPIVVNPVYPTNLIAATGPVTIKVGTAGFAEPQWVYDSITNNNRSIFTAQQVLAVEFNATIAVRAT